MLVEPSARPGALPRPPTPLIGRQPELDDIEHRLVRAPTRLLTLVGPGGTGKTRLALAAAERLWQRLADGVTFVDLSQVADADLVLPSVAEARGIRESGGQGIAAALHRVLAEAECLLVLDNLEHVLAAASALAQLLEACPGVKVLATSREPLRIRWEQELPVQPLALPAPDADADAIGAFPAVALFVQRAQAVAPTFTLSETNAPAVAEVCRRLDGLPLAIELAAARVKVLPPAALLARLDGRLDLLARPSPDLPARHQALRQTIAWSYALLTPAEQAFFRRLGVFTGGWTAEAAQAVSGEPSTLEVLSSLVDKSLVRVDPSHQDDPRFSLLETIRAFAREQLEAAGERADAAEAHADYFLGLARRAGPELTGPRQRSWNARLTADLPNIRAAVDWWLERGKLASAMDLLWAIRVFFWAQGHLADLRRLSDAFLERGRTDGLEPALQGRVLFAAGFAAVQTGDFARGRALMEQAAEIARRVDDPTLLGQALLNLAFVTPAQGDIASAWALFDTSAAAFQRAGDEWGEAMTRMGRGEFAVLEGDLAKAETWSSDFVERARARGDVRSLAQGLLSLATLAVIQHDYARAARLFGESIAHAREATSAELIAYCLSGLAAVAAARRDWLRAARLMGAGSRLWEPIGSVVWPNRQRAHAEVLERIRAELGSPAFEAAWAEGRQAGADDVLGRLPGELSQRAHVAATGDSQVARLTPREREVAALIARGLTSPQIAEALVITERTADAHADNIRGKLGLHSRAEIAAWATEHGLRGREAGGRQ